MGEGRALHTRLDSLGVAHTWAEYAGDHDRRYCRTHPAQALEAVARGMR